MLNKGDSVDKVKYEFKDASSDVLINHAFDFRYVDITAGNDDIQIVHNYLPPIEYVISNDDTILDNLSRGFKVDAGDNVVSGDLVILSKPKSIRYIVKPLESIEDIAKKFGLKSDYIMQVNNLSSPKLFVGQILWI